MSSLQLRALPVQKIDRHTVGRNQVGASDCGHASVGGQNHYGRQSGLQRSVQKGETLDIQHMHLSVMENQCLNAVFELDWVFDILLRL